MSSSEDAALGRGMNTRLPFSGVALGRLAEPAAEAVLMLCRRKTTPEEIAQVVGTLLSCSSAGAFQSVADSHQVLGLALSTLEQRLPADLRATPGVRELLEPLRARRRSALLWQLEQDRVLRILAARQLRPLLLKGAALRLTVYGDRVERRMGDLDLLVSQPDVDAAVDSLIGAGYGAVSSQEKKAYQSNHFHFRLVHPQGFIAEVHWGLFGPSSPFQLAADAFLRRARETPQVGSPNVLVPSREDMVLHLAGQNVENGFSELRRLVDLDRVVSDPEPMDWEYTVASARAGGLQTVLALSLRLSRTLLGTEVPKELLPRLDPPRYVAFHIDLLNPEQSLITQYARRRAAYALLLSLWLTVKWRERLAILAVTPTSQEDWLRSLRDPSGSAPGLFWRMKAAVKILAFQGWRYLAGLTRLFRTPMSTTSS